MKPPHLPLLRPASSAIAAGLTTALATTVAGAAGAAEPNLAAMTQYAPVSLGGKPVTSISQFSDVRPTDWAYQALSNLIERYGCVAGYPDGTYKGGRAMTRFEAAALLNACLDRVTEVTDELKRLMAEFEKELAVLKGRVDGLESKVKTLEAQQFSTTTKLRGEASMVLGGGSNTGFGSQVSANYNVKLQVNTSFTGKDLLRTTLRDGNFKPSMLGNGNTELEPAFQSEGRPNSAILNRLYYQFPIGENWTATAGAKVEQSDMLAVEASAYSADILNLFTFAGAPAAYSDELGAGLGLWYKKDGFSISVNYVSAEKRADDSSLGIFKGFSTTAQLGYAANTWGTAVVYTYSSGLRPEAFLGGAANSMGLSGYWEPSEAAWVPSISAGLGYSIVSGAINDAWSWMVGLQWSDAFMDGHALGMALGSAGAQGAGNCKNDNCNGGIWTNSGKNTLAYELWYRVPVSDNISLTPAFFWVQNNGLNDTYGGVVKARFSF
jgi:hypothetical protein